MLILKYYFEKTTACDGVVWRFQLIMSSAKQRNRRLQSGALGGGNNNSFTSNHKKAFGTSVTFVKNRPETDVNKVPDLITEDGKYVLSNGPNGPSIIQFSRSFLDPETAQTLFDNLDTLIEFGFISHTAKK